MSATSRHVGWPVRIAAAACTAVFAVPLAHLLVRAGGDAADSWEVLSSGDAAGPLWRTVQLGVAVTAVCAVLGTGVAWIVVRTDVPFRRTWRVACALPLVIPSFVGAASLIAAFAPGGLAAELLGPLGVDRLPEIRGLGGATVVLSLLSYPYVYLPVAARLSTLPASFEESAALMGGGTWSTFTRVVLPQVRSAIAAGSLLVFLYVISDFGAVQLVRYDTLTRAIYAARLLDPTTSTTLGLLLAALALVVAAAEHLAGGRSARPLRGDVRRARLIRLGRGRIGALALVAGVVGASLLAPVTVLVWWSLRDGEGRATASGAGSVAVPLWNSTWIAVLSALVAVVVVLPVAVVVVRRRSRVGAAASTVVTAAFALPGLVVALALASAFLRTPLYLTFALLVAGYVVHFGGQALRGSVVALDALPTQLGEAARLLGARPIRRLLRVELPVLLPGLGAAAGMVMLSVLKELPATLLLAPIGFETLATRIWSSAEDLFLVETGQASLLLIGLSAVLTWILVIRRLDRLA